MTTDRKKLDRWEDELRSSIGEGDLLLGELGYSHQDLDEIGGLLANTAFQLLRNKRYTINEALQYVRDQCPLTFALYLVLEGIYYYEGDDLYWHGPIKRLKIQQNHTHQCGRLFLDTLAKYNLPTFGQSGGHTYITPILLHGGIPNDHLERFFDFLLRYEVEPHRIAMDAETLLIVWRGEPDEHLASLPKPVSRFLRDGGNVATDFVARCLELFNVTTEEEAFQLDLPERVRQVFWEWRTQNEEQLRKRPSRSLIRLHKPILTIEPYTIGVSLYLPPQHLPTRHAPKELTWRISSGDHIQQITPDRQRVEGGYAYHVAQNTFIWPESHYLVRLEADGEELQSWHIDGIDDPPLLIFEPYDDYQGDALNQDDRHRPGQRWLLYPQNFELIVPGQKLRDLPGLAGNWQAYRLEEWDLQPGQLQLIDPQDAVHNFTIVREQSRRPPRLTDESCLQLSTTRADFSLYSGRPPHLIIPTTQPHRWRVAVRADGMSQPAGYRHYRLSTLPFVKKNGEIWVDLAIPKLLGDCPVGKFEIVARGPLGRNRSLGLRIAPHLEITGHNLMYLADADQPAYFQIVCDGQMRLRQSPPQEGVDIREEEPTEEERNYTIVAQPDVQQLTLQLNHELGPKIPLNLPIHRLRWGIKTESGEETRWHTRPYSFYPDGLPSGAELRINVPLVADHLLQVGWRLINADGNVLRQVYPGELRVQLRMRISMMEVMASWREHQETLCWQIIIQRENGEPPIVVDAYYLLPELNLGDLAYEWETKTERTHLTLCWERPQLGQCQVRLWPLDRPWEDPITRIIPKTVDTIAEWQFNNEELPAEAYLAEVTIYNPWSSQKPQRPERRQPNTLLVKPPGLDEHYADLAHLRDAKEATPEQLLSLLIHQHYSGQKNEMYKTNKCIADQAIVLPVIWLIQWANIVRELDKVAYSLAQIKIFAPAIIERLAEVNTDLDQLHQLFAHLSDKFIEQQGVWVLESGLRGKRRYCLESLCNLSLNSEERKSYFQVAMKAVLEDVENGSLLVDDAIEILHNNAQEAAVYLAQDGGQDAAELLRYLTQKTKLRPNWCWTGMTLNTDVGDIIIRRLRHRQTAQRYYCTPLTTEHYADGELHNQDEHPMLVRLDLQNKLLHFDGYEPYQCPYCRQVYRSVSSYQNHQQHTHPDMSERPKRIKRDLKLSRIAALTQMEEES